LMNVLVQIAYKMGLHIKRFSVHDST
jgi:hypothetical protein